MDGEACFVQVRSRTKGKSDRRRVRSESAGTPHAQRGELKWFDSDKPMEIQAGSLIYKEAESKVWLLDWSKFKRATLSMEAGPAIVSLDKGAIRHVEAANARGDDIQKERKVEYAADRLDLQFTDKGAVEDVIGDGNAKLVSTAATGCNDGHLKPP